MAAVSWWHAFSIVVWWTCTAGFLVWWLLRPVIWLIDAVVEIELENEK